MNAKIDIQVGVQSKKRFDEEVFRPTRTWSTTFEYTTDLDNYLTQTSTIGDEVYANVLAEKLNGAEITLHLAVRVDNVTHPTPAAGVVPLSKAHRDCKLSHDEATSDLIIEQSLNQVIADLRSISKY